MTSVYPTKTSDLQPDIPYGARLSLIQTIKTTLRQCTTLEPGSAEMDYILSEELLARASILTHVEGLGALYYEWADKLRNSAIRKGLDVNPIFLYIDKESPLTDDDFWEEYDDTRGY